MVMWKLSSGRPAGAEVDPAFLLSDRSDSGARGEPVRAARHELVAKVGEHKIDCGGDPLPVDAEQFVQRAVAGGLVGFHPEPVRDRFELFGLFVDAVSAAPPPALMNEGAV